MSSLIIENLKQLYERASEIGPEDLAAVYSDDVIFTDPVHRIDGIVALSEYFSSIYKNVSSCRFDYHGELIADTRACIRWTMTFRHAKLARGQEIHVNGISYLRFDDKISYHEDYYDLGSMIYEHIPVLGASVRFLKNRINLPQATKS